VIDYVALTVIIDATISLKPQAMVDGSVVLISFFIVGETGG
jgi:hypothetical protein